jgi:molybdopterin-containing oxidoreductase family iron-sulfur binding subunit
MSKKDKASRREFLKDSLILSVSAAAGAGLFSSCSKDDETVASGGKVKLLSPDGKLVEVDSLHTRNYRASPREARKGIPGRKFVMVIDLSRCKHALKCQEACHHAHHLQDGQEWLKVYKMKDSKHAAPYWMPKPCMHCDNPQCLKVCPTGATFQRSDGIILIDTDRCIGCRFCMVSCPYSSRTFSWGEPKLSKEITDQPYSPETSVPAKKGTVGKCDFCPDLLKNGKLPHCVTACPNGVFYFGDMNEDAVTNGDEMVKFSELMRDNAGYRFLEALGTDPSVYYLPPVNRLFPFKEKKDKS